MGYAMRRTDREVTSPDLLWRIADEALVLHLAFIDARGEPYATCVHFARDPERKRFYFHGAMRGRKAEALARCPRAAFQLVGAAEMLHKADRPGYHLGAYRSVMGMGRVRVVADPAEKRVAIALLHERYRDAADGYAIDDAKLERVVNVHALEIEEITGKIKGYYNPDKPNARMVAARGWDAGVFL